MLDMLTIRAGYFLVKKLTVTKHSFHLWFESRLAVQVPRISWQTWSEHMPCILKYKVHASITLLLEAAMRKTKHRNCPLSLSVWRGFFSGKTSQTCTPEEVNVEKHALLLSKLLLIWRQKIFTNKYLVPYQVMDHLPGSSSAQPTEDMMLPLPGNVPPAYRVNLNPRHNSEGPSNSMKILVPLCLPLCPSLSQLPTPAKICVGIYTEREM